MGFFKDAEVVVSKVLPPTLDQQVEQANQAASLAISLFERAAENLEHAANALDSVVQESVAKAAVHAARAEDAANAADKNRARAEKIRNLLD